jgi:hypothetical protein
MAGITLAQAQAQLDAFLAASLAVANNQSYSIGDRTYTRADAEAIQDAIDRWDERVRRLTRGGIRVRGGTAINV